MFRILIVEDDDTNFLLLKKIISAKFSIEILRGVNGLEALKILERNEVDGMILDISMPVMSGLEVLKTIRKDDKLVKLPVLMLTALNGREEVEIAMRFGVYDYLLKPFYAKETIERIRNFFDFIEKMKNNEEYKILPQLKKSS